MKKKFLIDQLGSIQPIPNTLNNVVTMIKNIEWLLTVNIIEGIGVNLLTWINDKIRGKWSSLAAAKHNLQ